MDGGEGCHKIRDQNMRPNFRGLIKLIKNVPQVFSDTHQLYMYPNVNVNLGGCLISVTLFRGYQNPVDDFRGGMQIDNYMGVFIFYPPGHKF